MQRREFIKNLAITSIGLFFLPKITFGEFDKLKSAKNYIIKQSPLYYEQFKNVSELVSEAEFIKFKSAYGYVLNSLKNDLTGDVSVSDIVLEKGFVSILRYHLSKNDFNSADKFFDTVENHCKIWIGKIECNDCILKDGTHSGPMWLGCNEKGGSQWKTLNDNISIMDYKFELSKLNLHYAQHLLHKGLVQKAGIHHSTYLEFGNNWTRKNYKDKVMWKQIKNNSYKNNFKIKNIV